MSAREAAAWTASPGAPQIEYAHVVHHPELHRIREPDRMAEARAHRGPSPALPALRNPPSPLPTRRAQLRHLSPEVALDTARDRRLPDGG